MAWFNLAYQYKKAITLLHAQVSGGSDLSNYPALISMTDPHLKTAANGGYVQSNQGFDMIFTDGTETTQLSHEIESYNGVTGTLVMWVKVPTLSASVDTTVYLYFSNVAISISQEQVPAVWDANFLAVYHLKETSGTANSIKDSTSNANAATPYTNFGTSTVGSIATSSGQIDGAQSFDGGTHLIQAPNSTSLNSVGGTDTLTVSAWVKRAAAGTTGGVVSDGGPGLGGWIMGIGVPGATINQIKFTRYGVIDILFGNFPADTNWHYLACTGNSSGCSIYIDGALNGTATQTQLIQTITANFQIGSGESTFWDGLIDEVRYSNTARSAGWLNTDYNIQANPSNFFTVGVLQTLAGHASLAYGSVVMRDGPAAYYRLGEASGTLAVDEKGVNSGTISSAGITYNQAGSIFGDPNTAMLFDGSTGYIALPSSLNPAGWTAITVELWVKFLNTSTGTSYRVVSNAHTDVDNTGFQLCLGTASFFGIGIGTGQQGANFTTTNWRTSSWWYVVGTYDNAHIKVYAGNSDLSTPFSQQGTVALTGAIASAAQAINIGRNAANGLDQFPGYVDEVAIYNKVLTLDQLTHHFTVGVDSLIVRQQHRGSRIF